MHKCSPKEWNSQDIMLQLTQLKSTSLLKIEVKIFLLKVFVSFKGRIHTLVTHNADTIWPQTRNKQ